jgi:hypothetical protein
MANERERRPPSMSGSAGVNRTNGGGSPPSRGWIIVGLIAVGLLAVGLLSRHERTSSSPVVPGPPGTAPATSLSPGQNRPPVLLDAHLVPDAPNAHSRIAVAAEARDPDGDPIRYEVTWFRNGARVEAPDRQVLPDGAAHRGDHIYADVVATDGVHHTQPMRTREVVIGNLPPVASEVKISPLPLLVGEEATASASGADPDGDSIQWRYEWILNGQTVSDVDGPVFPGDRIHRDDRLRVIATPDDGSTSGTSTESAEATVGNRPPRIVSVPPQVPKNSQLNYSVRAEDPDGDPVSLKLDGNVPQGVVLSPSGVLTADLANIRPGRYEIHVVATDPQGASDVQVLDITVPEQPPAAAPARSPNPWRITLTQVRSA